MPTHLDGPAFDPAECLDLPTSSAVPSAHAALRATQDGAPLLLLTEAGRELLCAHLAAGRPWTSWPADFLDELRNSHPRVQPPTDPKAWDFHLVNLLWRYHGWAFRRSDLDAIKSALFVAMRRHPHPEWFPRSRGEDDDVIQHVNKSGQWGITHQQERLARPDGKSVAYYFLRRPLSYDTKNRFPKDPGSPIQLWSAPPCACAVESAVPDLPTGLAEQRQRVLAYLTSTWLNVPEGKWTPHGHRDPDNKDRGEVAQPAEYNRLSKSDWKFDDLGLKECPSVDHLIRRLDYFYPSEAERERLLEALMDRLS